MKIHIKHLIGFILFSSSFIVQCLLAIISVYVILVAIGVAKMLIITGTYASIGNLVDSYILQCSLVVVIIVFSINIKWLMKLLK